MRKIFLNLIICVLVIGTTPFVFAQEKELAGKLGISANFGGNAPVTGPVKDRESSLGPIFGGGLKYGIVSGLSVGALFNYTFNSMEDDEATPKDESLYKSIFMPIALDIGYDLSALLPESPIVPFITVGLGIYMWDFQYDGETRVLKGEDEKGTAFGFNGGVGVEFSPISKLGIKVYAKAHYMLNADEEKFGAVRDASDGLFDFGGAVTFYLL